ncbi:MAG: cobalamin-dependent protein [Pseudomonadota bacterium]
MSESPFSDQGLDVERYESVQSKLRRLKSQLPVPHVESLAREVIRQMTDHGSRDLIQSPDIAKIEELSTALVSSDDQSGARFIREVRAEGATDESVYLNYLAAAARMLGEWWEDNRVNFVQVTYGTSRMYAIMRSMRREVAVTGIAPNKAAVFASVPGEAHFLGVTMAADLLRRDGWDIVLLVGKSHDELVDEIGRSGMIVIGLSASSDKTLEALTRLVVALRIRVPHAAIFVSGNIAEDRPDTLELMDVDGFASDFKMAKSMLEQHATRYLAS